MNLLKNWNVKSPKTVELILLILMIAGLCSQAPVLAQPVQMNSNFKIISPQGTSSVPSTAEFISTWNTSKTSTGSSTSTQIALPLVSTGTYNFMVDWGDGSSNSTITSYTQGIAPHNYSIANIYTIRITGVISGWEFNNGGDAQKIIAISQWGPLNLGNTGSYFYGASNLFINATDALNLTGTTNLADAFEGCSNLGNSGTGNFNGWDTSAVTNMRGIFRNSNFNQPIGSWNVSSVTDMSNMFYNDQVFNQNISTWDVSHVTTMSYMFLEDSAFNQPIGNWSVSNVNDMSFMFSFASTFNQNISTWDVSNVTTMSDMFDGASSFNQPIGSWNVAGVKHMDSMFSQATSFNQFIGNWSVSNVTTMTFMFQLATSFNQPIGNWNVSHVTTMSSMFSSATSFNQSLDSWNVSHVAYMDGMFSSALSFNQNISSWDVNEVTTMASMFSFTPFNYSIGNWDVSNVTDMNHMFYDDQVFNQSIGSWNVTDVTTMANMFTGDTLSVQNYDNLLIGWSKLPKLQINVVFDAGNSQYSPASANARQSIIGNFSWTITDGGEYVLSAPQTLSAISGYSSILLSWSAPSTDGGSAIRNYTIYRSTTSGTGFTLIATVSNSTFSYNDTGLVNGQSYYYIVSVTNTAGVSTNSSQITATPYTVPTAPQSLLAQPGTGYAFLSWSAPSSDGGSAITGYNIYISTNGGTSFTLANSISGTTTFYNLTGLIGGTTYYFKVAAVNKAGFGPNSSVVNANVYSLPTVPQSFTAQAGHSSVLLSWSAPSSDGGLTLTGYNIYISTNGGTSYSLLTPVSASTLSYNDTTLTNGQTYYFKISAMNSAGSSANSTVVSATPYSGSTVPTAPQSLTAQPGAGYVFLSWSAPSSAGGSAITGYNIYVSTNGGISFSLLTTVSASILSHNDTGLTNGQPYYFEATASNSAGEGAYSSIVSATPYTIPNAPQNIKEQAGNTYVVLSWSVPSFNGGSAITGYNIYISTNGGTSFTFIKSVAGSTLSYNVTGLTNSQTYYFEITANNNAGSSVYSSMVSATPNSGATVPSAPPSLLAQSGNTFIDLSWNASKSDGGSTITGYNIYESTDGGSSYTLLTAVGATTLSYNVTGLTNSQTYYFEITAKNSVGMSSYSPYALGTPFAPFNHSSTSSTSTNSNKQSTGGTNTASGTITTTDGFIFIFPMLSMLFIYFKRQKKN